MPALKTRKKATKVSKKRAAPAKKKTAAKKATRKPAKKAMKAKRIAAPAPHPDETSVRLGPHHVDRHPVAAGIQVHRAPMPPMTMKHPPVVVRHH